jgi:hypothetical protein
MMKTTENRIETMQNDELDLVSGNGEYTILPYPYPIKDPIYIDPIIIDPIIGPIIGPVIK